MAVRHTTRIPGRKAAVAVARPLIQLVPAGASEAEGQAPVRVVVVEGYPLMARALVALLRGSDDVTVVGVASRVDHAIWLCEANDVDVVIMDSRLPDGPGAEAAAAIRERPGAPAIVFFSGDESPESLLDAVEAGASGYVVKTESPKAIVSAIRRAAAGEMLISPDVLARLLEIQRERSRREHLARSLTSRELAVLRLMAEGRDNAAIAAELVISVATARTHARNILEKLGAHSKLEAVSIAVKHGVIEI